MWCVEKILFGLPEGTFRFIKSLEKTRSYNFNFRTVFIPNIREYLSLEAILILSRFQFCFPHEIFSAFFQKTYTLNFFRLYSRQVYKILEGFIGSFLTRNQK